MGQRQAVMTGKNHETQRDYKKANPQVLIFCLFLHKYMTAHAELACLRLAKPNLCFATNLSYLSSQCQPLHLPNSPTRTFHNLL